VVTGLRHGVRPNLEQILLLVAVNGFVGAMVGVERSVLPLLGREFGLVSHVAITSFIVSFGISKACTNLVAGRLADRIGRRAVLVFGWMLAIPVPLLVLNAQSWTWVVTANALLGVNQGICWTLTLFMKLDLGGPRRRGLTAGMNETIGYGAVALVALAATEIAARHGLRPYPFYLALAVAILGLLAALLWVRETLPHVKQEVANTFAAPRWRDVFARVSWRDSSLLAAVQAGMVRNLADGMAWGLLLLLFSASLGQPAAGTLSWLMVACFALPQVLSGVWSDSHGRKWFVVSGMTLIGVSLVWTASVEGFRAWAASVALLGVGGALMYPTVIAALSDQMDPAWRATGLGVYRFWRDMGYAAGALSSGLVADLAGRKAAVFSVAAVCFLSTLIVAAFLKQSGPRRLDP